MAGCRADFFHKSSSQLENATRAGTCAGSGFEAKWDKCAAPRHPGGAR
jgi:hypothetical protein